jgi:26S proteasome regulatory subunit N10
MEETQENPDGFAESLNDPQFLRDVLQGLPGVDVDSEAVRAALEQVQQQQKKDTDDTDDNGTTKKKKDEK